MKVGDVVLDLHGEKCVITEINETTRIVTLFNLRPGMYNPQECDIEDIRTLHENR